MSFDRYFALNDKNTDLNSPTQDDLRYLRNCLCTLASCVPRIANHIHIPAHEPCIVSKDKLHQIFLKYNGRMTRDKYHELQSALASLYHISSEFDADHPDEQWRLIGKLCQCLCYFIAQNDRIRIKNTSQFLRVRSNPRSKYYSVWTASIDLLKADSLELMLDRMQNFEQNEVHRYDPLEQDKYRDLLCNLQSCYEQKLTTGRNRNAKERGRDKRPRKSIQNEVLPCDYDADIDTVRITEILRWQCDSNDESFEGKASDERPIKRAIYVDQTQLSTLEKNSSSLAVKRIKAAWHHANLNELMTDTNLRVLPIEFADKVCNQLLRVFHAGGHHQGAAAWLLLVICTGRLFEELIADLTAHKKTHGLIDRKSPRFNAIVTVSPQDSNALTQKFDMLQNSGNTLSLPLPEAIHQHIISQYKHINKDDMQAQISELIGELKIECDLPIITENRLKNLLNKALINQTAGLLQASVITGRNNKKMASSFYCGLPKQQILDNYLSAIKQISPALHQLLSIQTLDADEMHQSIGSYHVITPQAASKIMQALWENAMQLKQRYDNDHSITNFIAYFNAYTAWLWQLSLLLTSVRPVIGSPGALSQFNFDVGLLRVSDKEQRSLGNARMVPLCPFLITQIKQYIAFLRHVKQSVGLRSSELNDAIEQILTGDQALFNIIDDHLELNKISPSAMQSIGIKDWTMPDNWARHFVRSYLSSQLQVPETLMLAIYGHELDGQELLHPSSSLGLGLMSQAAKAFEAMAKQLQLQGMVAYGN